MISSIRRLAFSVWPTLSPAVRYWMPTIRMPMTAKMPIPIVMISRMKLRTLKIPSLPQTVPKKVVSTHPSPCDDEDDEEDDEEDEEEEEDDEDDGFWDCWGVFPWPSHTPFPLTLRPSGVVAL